MANFLPWSFDYMIVFDENGLSEEEEQFERGRRTMFTC